MTQMLFGPYTLGRLALANRTVMAPMTRNRALGNVPGDLEAAYYAQRATAGLIVTEGVSPSPNGLGYPRIPGLFSDAHVAGWRKVTTAVHAAGGHIVAQLMHTGRASHQANLPAGATVLAPSAVALGDTIYVDAQGPQPATEPAAMTEAQIQATIAEYATASQNAIAAGFDGVELHGANGYLIDQFLNTKTNLRSDAWGGDVQGRIRFAVEVAKRCAQAIGADRVGIRLSPYGVFNGMAPDAEMDALYLALAAELSKLGLLYVHIVDHSAMGAPTVPQAIKDGIRAAFKGTYILSGGYDAARAEADLQAGRGDLVAFGRPFLSNPSLVAKLKAGAALTPPDFSTFYTPGPKGYVDYPA
ncbi:MAG: alkene reductase [Deltaproteobacteria bacterium]|nr:alkene reductase [Deltaproteobacteria bacterium]